MSPIALQAINDYAYRLITLNGLIYKLRRLGYNAGYLIILHNIFDIRKRCLLGIDRKHPQPMPQIDNPSIHDRRDKPLKKARFIKKEQ